MGWSPAAIFIAVVVIALVCLLAVAVMIAAKSGAYQGGAAPTGAAPAGAPTSLHSIEKGLETVGRDLDPVRDDIAQHATRRGGAARTHAATKPWTEFTSWDALIENGEACEEYLRDRANAHNNPNFDWSSVLREVSPLLADNREHCGLINLDTDGKTLKVVHREASTVEATNNKNAPIIASIPAEIVTRVTQRPALYVFHTHIDRPNADPMPSSGDLVMAIYHGAVSRYAGEVVISRYGVLVYGLANNGYTAIHAAGDPRQAELNLCYDVVTANEARRSWAPWRLQSYLSMYDQLRMYIVPFPSPVMVADIYSKVFDHGLLGATDTQLIQSLANSIAAHSAAVPAP